ncbi:hypothetical protein DFH06DRAFT_1132653 [Mycena polygramma]|nr:hypothetical protein DFH06DRAFT_1132653 [Mycena polygramma]
MTHSSMWECCEDVAVNENSLEKDCKRKRADNLEECVRTVWGWGDRNREQAKRDMHTRSSRFVCGGSRARMWPQSRTSGHFRVQIQSISGLGVRRWGRITSCSARVLYTRNAGSGVSHVAAGVSDIIGAKPEATQSRGEPEFSQSADATAGQRQAQKSPGVSTAAAALESGYTGRQKTATKKKDDGGKEKERCIATDRHWP